MKVALVYDRVNKIGGAERVLQALHEIYPEAPLYTTVYNPQTAPWAREFKVRPSFLQNIPFANEIGIHLQGAHIFYLPFCLISFIISSRDKFHFLRYPLNLFTGVRELSRAFRV